MKEPFLEPFLRKIRLNKVMSVIKKYKNPTLLDIGCGWEARMLKEVEPFIKAGIGIDFKAPKLERESKITTIDMKLKKSLPFENNYFDVITMLAVLEHLEYPIEMASEIFRILKPNGCVVITVPSRYSKPVLEFMAFKLRIISYDEIKDHKKYYNRNDIFELFGGCGFEIEMHKYFQFGMNNFCVCKKR